MNNVCHHFISNNCDNSNLRFICLNQSLVEEGLLNLNANKGYGPDQIPIFFVKRAHSLKKPLTILFNFSLRMGYFPQTWKSARVITYFTNGHRNNVTY